ncbi:MAG TPA: ABC transporter permease [Chloroflexota bacterium]
MSEAMRDDTVLDANIAVDASGAQGIMAPTESVAPTRAYHRLAQGFVRIVPPAVVFVLILAFWQFGVKALHIPIYALPTPTDIWHTLPTISELPADARYTTFNEALPGFIIGSGLGFLVAVIAMRFRFVARGVMPYAVISNSIPIIGMAPIAVALFGFDWQSKAFIVAVLTFFPMVINAYRGLTSLDLLSLQLMRSYAANGWETFYKLRLPSSLPYVFNALKINATLAMIGAIIGEYFGSPSVGLGNYIHNETGMLAMPEVWSAVVVACVIGISAYLLLVALERWLTSWHISYRSGR